MRHLEFSPTMPVARKQYRYEEKKIYFENQFQRQWSHATTEQVLMTFTCMCIYWQHKIQFTASKQFCKSTNMTEI